MGDFEIESGEDDDFIDTDGKTSFANPTHFGWNVKIKEPKAKSKFGFSEEDGADGTRPGGG